MASGPTNIGYGPQFSRDSGGVLNASYGGSIGSQTIFLCTGEDVPISQTALILSKFKVPYKMRVRKIISSVADITATASYDVYNGTDSALVAAAVTVTDALSTETTTFSSVAQETWQEDDEIQVRATTNGSGLIDGLHVWAVVVPLEDTADNPF